MIVAIILRKVIHDAQEITDHKKINNHNFEERLQNDRIFKRYPKSTTGRGIKENL